MGILRLLYRGAKEKVEEHSLRQDLEQKLGHRVSNEEMYSLGSHLNAAAPGDAAGKPLQYTQRDAATPFGDAKEPSKYKKYVIGAVLLALLVGLPALYVMLLSEYQYNRLNPFTPKPPENSFPAQIGAFNLKEKPDWHAKSSYETTHFDGEYLGAGLSRANYKVWLYDSEAEAQTNFEKKKKSLTVGTKNSQLVDDTAARGAAVTPDGYTSIVWRDGTQIKGVTSYEQPTAYAFEAALRNTAPAAIVSVKADTTITVGDLLGDYAKNEKEADKKYKDKMITFSGTVYFSDKDKEGNPTIGFLKPGSTNMADGTVVCTFDKSQKTAVAAIKKDDVVKLSGRVEDSLLGSVFLKECKKL